MLNSNAKLARKLRKLQTDSAMRVAERYAIARSPVRYEDAKPVPVHERHALEPRVFCHHGKVYRLLGEKMGLPSTAICRRCA